MVVSSSTAAKHAEGDEKSAVEAARFLLYFGGIPGNCDEVAPFFAEIDCALDEAQLLPLGTFSIAAMGDPRDRRSGKVCEMRQC